MRALEPPIGFLDTPSFHLRPQLKPLPAHVVPARPPATLSPQRVRELISLIQHHHLPKLTLNPQRPDGVGADQSSWHKIGHFEYGRTRELDGDGKPMGQALSASEEMQRRSEVGGSCAIVLLLVVVVGVLVERRTRRRKRGY